MCCELSQALGKEQCKGWIGPVVHLNKLVGSYGYVRGCATRGRQAFSGEEPLSPPGCTTLFPTEVCGLLLVKTVVIVRQRTQKWYLGI